MKRVFFTTTFMLIFSIFAANMANAQLRFGLQSGIVFSKAGANYGGIGKINLDTKYLLTNATNLYVSYQMQHRLNVAFEPGYTQKATDQNSVLTYIQLPVLAEYNVVDKLYLTAGPEFNILLNNDYYKSYKSFDTALQAGVYYGASPAFDVGFKFSRSLSNFLKEDVSIIDTPNSNVKIGTVNFYHYYFQFYTRYKF